MEADGVKEFSASGDQEEDRRYWCGFNHEGYGRGNLRLDYVRQQNSGSRYDTVSESVPESLRALLTKVTKDADFLLYVVALASTSIYLSRHSSHEKVVLCSPSLKGAGNNQLPIFVDFGDISTFKDALDIVRVSLKGAYRHQSLPFENLLEIWDIDRQQGRSNPLYEVTVRLEGFHDTLPDSGSDMTMSLDRDGDELIYSCTYDSGLYQRATIHTALTHIFDLMERGLSDPDIMIDKLIIISEQEKDVVADEWNATQTDYPCNLCLHTLIEKNTTYRSDSVALISEGCSYTYSEVNKRANQIAIELHRNGLMKSEPVGVLAGRSFHTVVAILGVLKAGGAYLPLDPVYPEERLKYLENNARLRYLLIEREYLSKHLGASVKRICIDDIFSVMGEETAGLTVPGSPCDLAYLIYTSGTTGNPKGVMLDHKGRVNNFSDFNRRFLIGNRDCILGVSSLSFDMSAYDILGTFMAGSRLVMTSERQHSAPSEWVRLMHREQVTIWHSVPSFMEDLLDHLEAYHDYEEIPVSLRLVLLGGDWIPVSMPDRIRALWPQVQVISLGGATELSMDSTIYPIDQVDKAWKSIPYGRAMSNQKAYVMDRTGDLQPTGMAGELYLGGQGVAWGYHDLPSLTAEKFIPDQYSQEPGARLYATGDLARYLHDGQLELIGRMDYQVKIRGLRIELGEIESTIETYPGVLKAVVVVDRNSQGTEVISAHVVLQAVDMELDQEGLRGHLVKRLPYYMVPGQITHLSEVPVTPNGKIDRKALALKKAVHHSKEGPSNPLETIVISMFEEVLQVEHVSRQDDFFILGGYSLLAIQLVSNLEEVFNFKVPLSVIFESPTPEKISIYIKETAEDNKMDINEIIEVWCSVNAMKEDELKDLLSERQN